MNISHVIEKYLDMEGYGSNLIVKKYCGFPKCLPLPCFLQHGWTSLPKAAKSELEGAKYKRLMLVYNKRRETVWREASKIPVAIMGTPFVHYRKMKKITQNANARGTIALPTHSTMFTEIKYDVDAYCKKLKALPKEFHPITVCLLHTDIKRGQDIDYRRNGFEVVSAGKKLRGSLDFAKNFYEILSSHKYATSNEIGTYTFYAIEMGLPFFLWGDEPYTVNIGNKDPNIGPTAKMTDYSLGRFARQLFNTGPSARISKSQAEFVEYELGINDAVGPKKIKDILWANTKNVRYWLLNVPMYFLLSVIKKITPLDFAYWLFERIHKAREVI